MSRYPSFEQGYDDTRARLESAREAEHLQAIAEREAEAAWGRGRAARSLRRFRVRPCGPVHVNPADCREGWQAHHVVPQQLLRQGHELALWHVNSGMGVCGLAHRQHHSGVAPIALDLIPLPVVDFLTGLGYGWYIEKHYAA